MADIHKVEYRVYYEDTDSGGVVYYANYLKFAERARTELVRSFGINQESLAREEGILFVVRKAELDLLAPARLDNLIRVETEIIEVDGVRIRMEQNIFFEKIKLCSIKVQLVVVNKEFKPTRIPNSIKEFFTP